VLSTALVAINSLLVVVDSKVTT